MTETEKDSAEIASETGFTGTFDAFMAWLHGALIYGGIFVHDEALNQLGRPVIKVETVTGGYSSDELLLGRIESSLVMRRYWLSSHRGGRTVYEFPAASTVSAEEVVWLEPDDGVFERVHRARRVRVVLKNGDQLDFGYDFGAELVFEEPDRDIVQPDGLLIVRPITEKAIEI